MFWRLNNIEKVRRDNFTGCKTLSKVEPMYLEVKLKEAKFNWRVQRLNITNQRTADLIARWNVVSNVRVRSLLESELEIVSID